MRCVHTAGNVCVSNTCRLSAVVTQSLRSMRWVITTQCAGAVGASGFVQWLRPDAEVTAHVHPLVANVRRVLGVSLLQGARDRSFGVDSTRSTEPT